MMDVELQKKPDELAKQFRELKTAQDVAALLEIPYRVLLYHLYIRRERERYTTFNIPKKRGALAQSQHQLVA